MAAYTTADLITSMKKRGLIPTSQDTFDDTDMVRVMDEEVRAFIAPLIMTVRENYFLEKTETDLVADTSRYELPSRAIGAKVKDIYYLKSGLRPKKLTMTDIEEACSLETTGETGEPEFFYFIDNFIELLPNPGASVSGSLRFYYYQRRNHLVTTAEVGKITAIASNVVTVNTLPTAFTTAKIYDFVKGKPGFQNLDIDIACSSIASTNMTFSSVPTGLAVDDYVCLAGESPIPQIIYDGFPLLMMKSVDTMLRALNDLAGSKNASEEVKRLKETFIPLISVRAEDQKKIIQSDGNIMNYLLGS